MKGNVKRVMSDRGFGFISGEDGGSYFFAYADTIGVRIEDLQEGDAVSFTPAASVKGPRAAVVERA